LQRHKGGEKLQSNTTLWQGDCLELMKDIPDGSVDLTVTSPPYDNLRTYNGNISQWSFEKFQAIAKELYRVTKHGGVVVWIVADATIKGSETGTSFRQALFFMECGFRLHDTMIYQKTSRYPANVRYQQDFEYMFVLSKGKPKTFNPLQEMKSEKEVQKNLKGRMDPGTKTYRDKDGTIKHLGESARRRLIKASKKTTKNRSNIWKINAGYMISTKDKIAFEHPAIFPEQLAQDHIVSWSNEGDTVLDCFMGSGTTGKMAVLNSRNFIGIELDPTYFDIAQKRIYEAKERTE
jgi:site-specific DNA-methyltransferase (adenine-specific)